MGKNIENLDKSAKFNIAKCPKFNLASAAKLTYNLASKFFKSHAKCYKKIASLPSTCKHHRSSKWSQWIPWMQSTTIGAVISSVLFCWIFVLDHRQLRKARCACGDGPKWWVVLGEVLRVLFSSCLQVHHAPAQGLPCAPWTWASRPPTSSFHRAPHSWYHDGIGIVMHPCSSPPVCAWGGRPLQLESRRCRLECMSRIWIESCRPRF